jgi:hypothetical protein
MRNRLPVRKISLPTSRTLRAVPIVAVGRVIKCVGEINTGSLAVGTRWHDHRLASVQLPVRSVYIEGQLTTTVAEPPNVPAPQLFVTRVMV